ncbi:MAG TPA: PDDEXK nuclease domain-containing protein [Phycisphaerae bacterium]|nr:PDDEXK nuclease domain-containing protein [Phycisphaerae bacterium]
MAKARRVKAKRSPGKALVRVSRGVSPALLADVRRLIDAARHRVAVAVNAELTWLYWQIGTRIRRDVLAEGRAEYGKKIVYALSGQLGAEYGAGFTRANLFHMLRFAEAFPEEKIVYALSRQLSWTHIRLLIYVENPLAREFYAEMARIERWSTRTLQERINSLLFERTAVSKQPEQLIARELASLKQNDLLTPDLVFRDPYFLDFLGLRGEYAEKDIESAIVRELERFILELGTDFAFVARQKRISVDGEDYYLDLLFYHRRLRRLVAIDLKLGKFQAADKGQMELYLRWLDQHERQPEKNEPIGLILCAGKSEEHVELLRLDQSRIRVAQYMTELLPRALLERKLHQAIQVAKRRLQEKDRLLPGGVRDGVRAR